MSSFFEIYGVNTVPCASLVFSNPLSGLVITKLAEVGPHNPASVH